MARVLLVIGAVLALLWFSDSAQAKGFEGTWIRTYTSPNARNARNESSIKEFTIRDGGSSCVVDYTDIPSRRFTRRGNRLIWERPDSDWADSVRSRGMPEQVIREAVARMRTLYVIYTLSTDGNTINVVTENDKIYFYYDARGFDYWKRNDYHYTFRRATDIANEKGEKLLRQGRYDEARAQFRKVLQDDPNNQESKGNLVAAYIGDGKKLLRKGHHSEAEAAYRKALELNPQNTEARKGLLKTFVKGGKSLFKQGHHSEAEAAYRKALELNPQNTEARKGLLKTFVKSGKSLFKQGRNEEAKSTFRKALEIDPDNKVALKKLKTLESAGKQAKSAKYHSEKAAGAKSYEEIKAEAGKVFDSPEGEDKGSLPPVIISERSEIEIPPELAKDEEMIQLQTQRRALSNYIDSQHKELEEIRHKKQTANPTEKAKLEVDEAKVKQEISNAENSRNFVDYTVKKKIKDYTIGKDWKKKPQPESSKDTKEWM
jgi:tetratricopeptide (TPR) repeat protein